MKLKRDYLTSDEMAMIVNTVLETEGAINREVVKVGLVYQLLSEEEEQFETCNEYYDKYISQEDVYFPYDVRNYIDMEDIIADELGVKNVIKEAIKDIEKKIDDINMTDLLGQFTQLKEVMDNAKAI